MSRATESQLSELHSLLARTMKEELKKKEVSASMLSVIVKFLKDNGIEALPENSEELQRLVSNLPDLEDIDPSEVNHH